MRFLKGTKKRILPKRKSSPNSSAKTSTNSKESLAKALLESYTLAGTSKPTRK